jgi:5-methyltetrahydropteroyltriglutamate--homocysteine methyltransferase
MVKILTDDIGSFPLPTGISKEKLREIAGRIVDGAYSPDEEDKFHSTVHSMFSAKLSSGIDFPNYPQVQEMIDGFFNPIEKYGVMDEPFVIANEKARIPEVEAIDVFARKQFKENGKPTNLRVCVTGPLDLYVRRISTQVEGDLLENLGKSIGSFIKNALLDEPHIKTKLISIDEPSLGLNPNIIVERENLVTAWNNATKHVKNTDVQIHLHAPAEAEIVFETEKINVIGVESAENPEHLKAFDKKTLDSHDRLLRVGIARSNITALCSDYEQKTGINAMNNPKALISMVDEHESPALIKKTS